MKLAISSDHGGFELKEALVAFLKERGHEVSDLGTTTPAPVDYPEYALKVAKAVASAEFERGIILCGTGIGVSIMANKVKGIRCALCHDIYTARISREHNDANVLALGGRILKKELACDILETWLNTNFEGGRHQRRIEQIAEFESQ